MALLRLKIGSEKYQVDPDKLTLNEACTLEEDFGVDGLSELDFFKARHLKGLFFIAVARKHPDMGVEDVLKKVGEAVTGPVFEDLTKQIQEAVEKAEAEAADPPSAGVNGAPAKKAGSRATRQKVSGPPS
jgi:hypothetical protein